MRVSALILLIFLVHVSSLEGITSSLDGKALEKRVDSRSLFRRLGFGNVEPSERRVLTHTDSTVPGGPNPQHQYVPPTRHADKTVPGGPDREHQYIPPTSHTDRAVPGGPNPDTHE
ncbi:hypothetical protein ACJRO7_017251 [Eucalyptus globulus]|uniref:Uncharacterized protein n=1 Tax=Eucalyptus globulus TaxID=34317 RepID=A0ABD3L0U9_EUCGL